MGTPTGTGMDENKTVELSDGRVMLNSRDGAGANPHFRKVAYSSDGGLTYSTPLPRRSSQIGGTTARSHGCTPDAAQR